MARNKRKGERLTLSWMDNLLHHTSIGNAFAGTIVYPPGGTYGPRIQPDLQLVLLHSGTMTVWIDGERLEVLPGQVAVLWPGHTELFEFSKTEETWHRWISIQPNEPSESGVFGLQSLPQVIPLTDSLHQLTDLMLLLLREHPSDSGVMRAMGMSALQLILAESKLSRESLMRHSSVLAAKQLIHERYQEEWTLERLAAKTNVSPEHLIRLFRASEQMTPMRYLWHCRVNKAVELLRFTGLSYADITERCGFKTTYHFSRLVKKQTSCTPTEIRNQVLAGGVGGG